MYGFVWFSVLLQNWTFVEPLSDWSYYRLGYCWLVGLLLLGVCFAGSVYCNVHKVLDASFHVICLALAVASLLVSLQLLTIAHCDRVIFRCLVYVLLNFSAARGVG